MERNRRGPPPRSSGEEGKRGGLQIFGPPGPRGGVPAAQQSRLWTTGLKLLGRTRLAWIHTGASTVLLKIKPLVGRKGRRNRVLVFELWQNVRPPSVIGGVQAAHYIHLRCSDVLLLAGVGRKVIKLSTLVRLVVHHRILRIAYPAMQIFRRRRLPFFPPANVGEQEAVRPGYLRIPEQRRQAPSVGLNIGWNRRTREFSQGREEVNVRGKIPAVARLESAGPAHKQRHSR